jgi:hypothetical protein
MLAAALSIPLLSACTLDQGVPADLEASTVGVTPPQASPEVVNESTAPPTVVSEAVPESELPVAGFIGGPRLSVETDSVDLGEVPMEIPINFSFRFSNVGDAPLNILDVSAEAPVGC